MSGPESSREERKQKKVLKGAAANLFGSNKVLSRNEQLEEEAEKALKKEKGVLIHHQNRMLAMPAGNFSHGKTWG